MQRLDNPKLEKRLETIALEALSSDKIQDNVRDFISQKISNKSFTVLPGLVDVHVHLREPGFFYKGSIRSETAAAARGGYTTVCSMPNLNPVPDNLRNLAIQYAIIDRDKYINVRPFGSMTIGEKGQELSDMKTMSPFVAGFSDDGKGIQNEDIMRQAMEKARSLNKVISAHCEFDSLLNGGYINEGNYSKDHNHKGISNESEWCEIERDLLIAEETKAPYHVCHISAKESLELIRTGKEKGINVTCETAPHYLLMDDSMLEENGRFKMNPPLRNSSDREALLNGIIDGSIDMIATDHAPHSIEEKSRGLRDSLNGVVGLETAFPLLYTNLVKTGKITLQHLINLMSVNPSKRFDIAQRDCVCIYDLNDSYTIDSNDFLSKGKATPFEGWKVYGRCIATICNGKLVYIDNGLKEELIKKVQEINSKQFIITKEEDPKCKILSTYLT